MIMILAGNDRKKARGALIVMLMLVSSALVMVNASSASAALPWGRPGAPEWEEPEEVRPYVRGPDEIAPTIRLRLAFEKGDAPGDWNEITPEVQSEDGKNLNIYKLSWSDYGDKPGKLQVHALVSDGIQELSDGIVKGSACVYIRGEHHYMGEYASTATNPVEGTFVYYHKLHSGYKFRLYVTVEDNAGNQADTRDTILYQIEVQSRPKDKPTREDITGGKPEPSEMEGYYYDSSPGADLEAHGAHWYKYDGDFAPVGIHECAKLRDIAYAIYWSTSSTQSEKDAAWAEYWDRVGTEYEYYTQDETKYATITVGM